MQVFIDAWLERVDPVLYIRACEDGQALFCLEGKDIERLMSRRDMDREDLMKGKRRAYRLKDIMP